jgi:hypothetical protein
VIEFKDVEISDGEWVWGLLKLSDFRGCEYAFGNIYMWSEVFSTKIARYKDFLIVKNRFGFLFPAGSGNITEIVEVLQEYCRNQNGRGKILCFTNVSRETTEELKHLYGSRLGVSTNRDYYDYIYETSQLASLCGRKLHAKRNHLNRFYENDWSFESITPDNIEEVTAMHNKWCDEKNVYHDRDKLKEAGAVVRGLERFFELGLAGGLIRVNGEIQAYTYGETAGNKSDDTFVVHVEKAFTKTQGTYTAINCEFVNYACRDYKYINREEDMGAENLRKAKMSYYPAFLLEKYCVTFE